VWAREVLGGVTNHPRIDGNDELRCGEAAGFELTSWSEQQRSSKPAP
jgi:hypothetical protein